MRLKVVDSDDEDTGQFVAIPRPSSSAVELSEPSTPMTKKVNLISKAVSERTHEGYLSKKGGIKGNRGWDKRWFSLHDGTLLYYKTRGLTKESGVVLVSSCPPPLLRTCTHTRPPEVAAHLTHAARADRTIHCDSRHHPAFLMPILTQPCRPAPPPPLHRMLLPRSRI